MTQNTLTDETGRMASLHRYEILDTPPEAPYDKITQLVKTVLNVPISAVSLVDADRQWFKSCVGLDVHEHAREISFCAHTIKSQQPMIIGDARRDPQFAENPLVLGPPFIGSYAGAPLLTPDGYAIGSLCAIDTVPRQFEAWQIDVLKSLAALVVDEFELRRLAQTDSLTGAVNRRAFLQEAEQALAAFFRAGEPGMLISIDIDHFKQHNDALGQVVADSMLRAGVAAIKEQLRAGDTLGRLGGDEFALLMPGADLALAVRAAEDCRAALAALNFAQDPQLRLTASFGIAAITPACVTAEAWLAEAELAREEAKQSGRNKYCIRAGTPPAEDEYILRLAPEDDADALAETDEFDEDFEDHRHSIEPLSRPLWERMQRSRRVKSVTSGRLAYGGLNPGLVSCQILNLSDTGISVEAFARLSPMPEFFSVEFCDIYCRAKTSRADGHKIDLEFIFDA